MFYLKNKYFTRWAKREGISDDLLVHAIKEFEEGLFEVSLGNHLFKKRIALPGRGKSGGARTILFYQLGRKLIFCFGFSKNDRGNLDKAQLVLLHKLSDSFQKVSDAAVTETIKQKGLIAISGMEVEDEE